MGAAMAGSVVAAGAAPIMMSAKWATRACEAWNEDAVLTDEPGSSDWIKNDSGRGNFENFLLPVGKVPADIASCPKQGARRDRTFSERTVSVRLNHCTLPKDLSTLPAGGARPAIRHP